MIFSVPPFPLSVPLLPISYPRSENGPANAIGGCPAFFYTPTLSELMTTRATLPVLVFSCGEPTVDPVIYDLLNGFQSLVQGVLFQN